MSEWWRAVHDSVWRILWLVRKELWQFRADVFFTVVLVFLPVMQMLLVVNVMGGGDGRGSPIAIIDHDRTHLSRDLVTAIENTGDAHVRMTLPNLTEADEALRRGDVEGVVVVPPGFSEDVRQLGRKGPTELLGVADGSNAWGATRIMAAISGAIAAFAESLARQQGQVSRILSMRPVKYFAITQIQDPVSSQMGFLLYQVVLLVAGQSIAREYERGTLEHLLVTPLSKHELIVGKAVPSLVLGVFNFFVLYVAGRLIWEVPMRGSLPLLLGTAILFVLAESAWGLFLSSHVTTQQQAIQVLFVQLLTDMSFCGYVVPIDRLPYFLRWISELRPLHHYLECLRAVMVRGADMGMILYHIGALVLLNLVFWTLSIRSVRRRIG